MLFSTNSLTTDAGRSTTSPAAIWLASCGGNICMVIAKSAETDKNLAKTILSMIQTSSMQDSYQVSEKVLKQMGGVTRLHKSKPQHASLAVLTAPEIPSLLVETGFISNKRDEMNLNSRAHREKLMKAIFAGIKSHFLERPPEGTLWANWKKNNKQHTVKRGESLSVLAHRYKWLSVPSNAQ